MKHKAFTKKLEHILTMLCTYKFRAVPCELYVFGSYARGAPEPGDLDLLLVYDRPSTFDTELNAAKKEHGHRALSKLDETYRSEFSRVFKRNRMDIIFDDRGFRLKSIRSDNEDGLLPYNEFLLLWSKNDQDWEQKLQSIKINPNEGRAYRNHIFDIKRLKCDLEVHDHIREAIEKDELILTKVPIDDKIVPVLANAEHNRLIELHGHEYRRTSSAVVRIMRYGFAWLESEKQVSGCHSSDNTWTSRNGTHGILLNTPINYVWWMLRRTKPVAKVCWIPVVKIRQENVMLIFERGPSWTAKQD